MARASTDTLLSLSQFGQIMGFDPWHLNQIQHGTIDGCKDVFYQFAWQRDWLSREVLAQAITRAEAELALHMKFWPAPKYIQREIVQYPRPARADHYGAAGTPRGIWKAVSLGYKKVLGPGLFTRVEISTGEAVTYTKSDGTHEDGFTLTVAATDANSVAITDPDEIAIYFQAADRVGDVEEQWRIRPARVSISGGNATITGHKADLADPLQQIDPTVPDQPLADEAASYVTAVDVYHVYRDDRYTADNPSQGLAVWEAQNCPPDCTVEYQEMCVGLRNAEMGQVYIQIPPDWPQNRQPDRLHVNYLSGVPLVNQMMDNELAQIVACLACCFLPAEKCGCDYVDRIVAYWRDLPSQNYTDRNSRQIPVREIIDSPWGPSKGSNRAWRYVQSQSNRFDPVLVI